MMKKEVKHLGISARVVLMVMVVFGTLFSSCYTKDDVPVIPDPVVIPNMYLIQGSVLASAEGVLENVKDANITCVPAALKSSVSDGNFLFYVEKPGTYTLSLAKAGYEPISYKVDVPEVKDLEGQLISVNVTLTMYKVTSLPIVRQVITNAGGTLTTLDEKATLAVPAGAVTEPIEIFMGVSEDVVPATSTTATTQGADAQFIYGKFGPNGLNFAKPLVWSIANPLTTYSLVNTELQYRKDGVITWEPQNQVVNYSTGNKQYSVALTHFSEYRIVCKGTVVLDSDTVTLPAIERIVNDSEQAGKIITEIPYKKKEGTVLTFVEGWDNLGADKAALEKLVRAAVLAKSGVAEFNESIVETDATFVLEKPIDLTFDYHLLSQARQVMEENVFTFKVKDGANNVTNLVVKVVKAGTVTIKTKAEYCGPIHHSSHHCGHVYNGGAGGGSVNGE